MNEYNEIYEELKQIDKLDAVIYSKLVNKYGEKQVNNVIDNIINEDDDILKFDYYLSRLNITDDIPYNDTIKAYIKDLGSVVFLSAEENKVLLLDLYNIMNQLEGLLLELGQTPLNDRREKEWLVERVEKAINNCNHCEQLSLLKKIYSEFLEKRNRLIEGNLRLVLFAAQKFYNYEINFLEYIQYGNLGLMKAIEKYDPRFETSFSTYAYYWIRQFINRGMSSILYTYKIPAYKIEENLLVVKATAVLSQKLGYKPSDLQIAEYLDIPVNNVIELKKMFEGNVSLDMKIVPDNSDKDGEACVGDFIEDSEAEVSEKIITSCMQGELINLMKNILSDKELYVLTKRFGLDGNEPQTLDVIGKKLGITRERVRQYECKAKQKIRINGKNLALYLK